MLSCLALMDFSSDAKRAFHLQSYGAAPIIEGVALVPLTRHADDGGNLTELARLADGRAAGLEGFTVRQINYSEVAPGTIKAFHLHVRQTDVWYVPPSDRMLVVLVDVRRGSRTEGTRMRLVLGAGGSRLLRIPPGVAHGVRNLAATAGRIVYFTDVHFSGDPATCDEGRLPWDWAGADQDLAHAVAVDPTSPDAHEAHGRFLAAAGRPGEAIASLDQARRLAPTRRATLEHLGLDFFPQGVDGGGLALAFLGKLHADDPGIAGFRVALHQLEAGEARDRLGRGRRAHAQDGGEFAHGHGPGIAEGLEHLLLAGEEAELRELIPRAASMQA